MSQNFKVGFIGLGQMATALASGFLRSKILTPDLLYGFDVSSEAGKKFAETTGAVVCSNPVDVVSSVDVLFFAVKPQYMSQALAPIKSVLAEKSAKILCVTIAAGLPISFFETALTSEIRLARVLPTTPW